jgi:uncharacterized protein
MMTKIFSGALLVLLLVIPALGETASEVQIPKQSDYISDYAEIVEAKTEMALALILKTMEEKYGNKLVILTVESTAPLSLADYSAAVFHEWGLGRDDLLFLVVVRDGRVRLDPGKRLNRSLKDEKLQEIMDREIMPSFQEGNFSQGVLRGTIALTSAIKEIRKQQAQGQIMIWIGLGLLVAATAALLLVLQR